MGATAREETKALKEKSRARTDPAQLQPSSGRESRVVFGMTRDPAIKTAGSGSYEVNSDSEPDSMKRSSG